MNLTLRQYEQQMRAQALRDYGCTAAEYDECYPPGSRCSEWIQDVLDAARRGKTLSRYVLDDLFRRGYPGVYRTIQHDYSAALPAGYLAPAVRRANQQQSAELAAARRRGLARAQQQEAPR